jgi:hypothetical protein
VAATFRLLPYALSRWLISRVNRIDGQPAVFYFHPWEIDAEHAAVAASMPRRASATTLNIARTQGRIAPPAGRLPLGAHGRDLPGSGERPAQSAERRPHERPHARRRGAPRDRVLSERWDAFVQAQPQATFFHLSGWLRVMSRCSATAATSCWPSDGRVQGVLPLAEVKKPLFGHSLASLPFAVYGGVVAEPRPPRRLEAEAERIAKARTEHLEYRNLGGVRHEDWPRKALRMTFRKEILPERQAFMPSRASSARWCARASRTSCVQIDAGVDRFFDLYADNVHRHGTPAAPLLRGAGPSSAMRWRCSP